MLERGKSEVLVVGAGPVGMITALLLAEHGVEVDIVDAAWRTAAHSYACALHPSALKLLDRLGLATELIQRGQRMDTVAFYEGANRKAEVRLGELKSEFPFVLVLPQSEFEDLLERRLLKQHGIKVAWNHRLAELRQEVNSAVVTLEKLGGTATGHVVPRWELVVQKRFETEANLVLAADGHHSWVRRHLGIEYPSLGAGEVFAVFEFESAGFPTHELRVAIDSTTTSALWPLMGGRCRWSLQLTDDVDAGDFPLKGRDRFRLYNEIAEQASRALLEKMVRARAPWFEGQVGEVHWALEIRFERCLARQLGQGCCWLVGDAAHQTGPVGVHSLNLGLQEADHLTGLVKLILQDNGSLDLLQAYDKAVRLKWSKLLNPGDHLRTLGAANDWTFQHRAKLLPCVPASGPDLTACLRQLKLELTDG